MITLDGSSKVYSPQDNGGSAGRSSRSRTGASRGADHRGGRGRAREQRATRQPSVTQVPWEEVDPNSDEVTPIFPFTEPVGPVHRLPDQSTPFEFYSLIVDRSVVEILVTQTSK